MTFDRPALLVLAALAAALPWLLGRIRDRRVRVPVGTLLLHERALEILAARRAAEPRAVERKRLVDPRLVVETVALVALALAAAGPRLEGVAPGRLFGVILDTSASVGAHGLLGLPPSLVRDLEGRGELLVAYTDDAPAGVTDGARWVDRALRARGVDAVLLVTDRPPSPPVADATIVVAADPGGPNRGIVAAGIREGEVLVRASAAEVVLRVRTRDGARTLLEGPGPVLRGALPPGFERAPLTAEIARVASAASDGEPYRDALPADDAVLLEPPGAPVRVSIVNPTPTALLRALEAAGGVYVGGGDAPEAHLEHAHAPGEGPPPERLVSLGAPWLRHADLEAMSVHVAPQRLWEGASGAAFPSAWMPIVVDERGRTIVGWRRDSHGRPHDLGIAIPLEMGAAATDWMTRRSFPLLLAEWLDAVAGDSRGEWRAVGLLDARETDEANPLPADVVRSLTPPPYGSNTGPVVAALGGPLGLEVRPALDAALPHLESAASRSPRRAALAAASTTPLAPWLLLAAALAALASWALTRDRRLGRAVVAA